MLRFAMRAKVVKALTAEQIEMLKLSAAHYVENAAPARTPEP